MQSSGLHLWIRIFLPLFLALFLGVLIFMMSQFREPPSFRWYGVVWFTSTIFLIWEGGWRIGASLDHRFPWRSGIFRRLMLQLMATNLIGILLYAGSYWLLNQYENRVLGNDNPMGLLNFFVAVALAVIIVQIINSIQIGYQLFQSWRVVEREAQALQRRTVLAGLESLREEIDPQFLVRELTDLPKMWAASPERTEALLREVSNNYREQQTAFALRLTKAEEALAKDPVGIVTEPSPTVPKAVHRRRFLIKMGNRLVLLSTDDIAAFYKDDLVLAYTQTGHKYPLDQSLEELSRQLDRRMFFRINRQCILHFKYLNEMRIEGSQLHLTLTTAFPDPLVVSQRNVGPFKRWLEQSEKP